MVALTPQPIAPLSPAGALGVRRSWGSMPRRDRRAHLVFSPAPLLPRCPAGAVSRFFPALETTSPLSAKGGGLAPCSPPALPGAGGSARGVGTGGLHSRSTSSSAVGLSPPKYSPLLLPIALPSSPAQGVSRPRLLACVPASGQTCRAGGTLKKVLLTQSSFRFADQRSARLQEQHPWGAAALCKTGHERP